MAGRVVEQRCRTCGRKFRLELVNGRDWRGECECGERYSYFDTRRGWKRPVGLPVDNVEEPPELCT